MGWNIGTDGFGIVLTAEVPELVHRYLGPDIRDLLTVHGLTVQDVGAWVSHPGGPKIIEAIEAELGVGPHALEMTWRSLAEVGNLSSASVLHVLRDTLRDRPPPPGSPGMLMAMGPGFSSELVLLRW
jgi:alkylresorcinol/alkylpyrone synthase